MNREAAVEALKAIREREGWNHAELARQIGVTRAAWHRIARGERRAGELFLRRALDRFPELREVLFLPADVRVSDGNGHQHEPGAEAVRDRVA